MTYLLLAFLAFYYLYGKNGDSGDFLSELNPEDVLPALKLLGVNETRLSSALSFLQSFFSGDAKPADLIKKAAPLIISLAANNKKTEPTANEHLNEVGFKPVESFIPADVKNQMSAFFK